MFVFPDWIDQCIDRRKSQVVAVAEQLHEAIDEHMKDRLEKIFKAKERYAYELRQKKLVEQVRRRRQPSAESLEPENADTQVIGNQAAEIAANVLDRVPENGTRFPGIVSSCFSGGTFERVCQRCSGDFSQTSQNKYIMGLPGLPAKVHCVSQSCV